MSYKNNCKGQKGETGNVSTISCIKSKFLYKFFQ